MFNIGFIMANGFETVEALYPLDILSRRSDLFKITTIGVEGEHIKSGQGVTIKTDTTIDKCEKLYDCIVIPGGHEASVTAGENKKVQEFIKNHIQNKKWVAAICAAPYYALVKTGLIGKAKAVTYPSLASKMGDNYMDTTDSCYVDTEHKIISSKAPGTATCFGFTIAKALTGETLSDVKKAMCIN